MTARRTYEPLLTIVTPTFNRGSLLLEAIASVKQQDYAYWEMLIVDDGSVDETGRLVAPLLEDSRIRYIRQDNQGQSTARNRGIKEAKGEFVAFLDSDNLWLPGKLRHQVGLLRTHPECDVLYGAGRDIDSHGNPLPTQPRRRYSGRITIPLLQSNFVNFNSAVVRTSCLRGIGGFRESLRSGEDYDLWLRLSTTCNFLYDPTPVSLYRVMPGRISSDVIRNLRANKEILQRFMTAEGAELPDSTKRDAWCRFYTRSARYRAHEGERRGPLADIIRAAGYRATSPHPWRALLRLGLLCAQDAVRLNRQARRHS